MADIMPSAFLIVGVPQQGRPSKVKQVMEDFLSLHTGQVLLQILGSRAEKLPPWWAVPWWAVLSDGGDTVQVRVERSAE